MVGKIRTGESNSPGIHDCIGLGSKRLIDLYAARPLTLAQQPAIERQGFRGDGITIMW